MLNGETVAKVWRYKVYIKDDRGNWIDFSSPDESYGGANALMSIGGITVSRDSDKPISPEFSTSETDFELDNKDGWLDDENFKPKIITGFLTTKGARQSQVFAKSEDAAGTNHSRWSAINAKFNPQSYNFSMGGWFRLGTVSTANIARLIYATNSTGTNGYQMYYNPSGHNLIITLYNTSATICIINNASVFSDNSKFTNNWTHLYVVVEYNLVTNTTYLRLYKNGSLFTSTSGTGKLAYNPGAELSLLGHDYNLPQALCYFQDFEFYSDLALPTDTIKYKYERGLYTAVEPDDYVSACWNGSDGDGATIIDLSGNGINLTASHASATKEVTPAVNGSTGERKRKLYPGLGDFALTKGGKTKAWKNKEVKITIETTLTDNTKVEDEIATYFIKNTLNTPQGTKLFKLESRSSKLKNRDASVVNNNGSWYENVSYRFIISKLLRTELSEDGVTLPANFVFPEAIERLSRVAKQQQRGTTPSGRDSREFSVLGRPPEFDGFSSNGNYLNKGGFPTCLHLWKYDAGTVYTQNGTDRVIFGNGTDWQASGKLRPAAGDSIILKSTTTGNIGTYEIESVDSDTQITLKNPIRGATIVDHASRISDHFTYTVSRLYIAVSYHGTREDATPIIWELWKYSPALDKYTLVHQETDFNLMSGGIYRIEKNNNDDTLVLLGFQDLLDFTNGTSQTDRRAQIGCYYKMTVVSGEITDVATRTNLTKTVTTGYPAAGSYYPITGLHHFRWADFDNESDDNYGTSRAVGLRPADHLAGVIGAELIAIPFPQSCGDIFCRIRDTSIGFQVEPRAYLGNIASLERYPAWIIGREDLDIRNFANEGFWDYYTDKFTLKPSEPPSYEYDVYSDIIKGTELLAEPLRVLKPFNVINPGFYSYLCGFLSNNVPTYTETGFKYSSNQKGAFCIHPGDVAHANSVWQAGGAFYFVGYTSSIDASDYPNFASDYFRLVTPYLDMATSGVLDADTRDTCFFWSRGLRFFEDATHSSDYVNYQPTYIEYNSHSEENELIISFTSFDQRISDNTTYPYSDRTRTSIYRILWEYSIANDANDYSGFSGVTPKTISTIDLTTSTTSFVVSANTGLLVGDIVRIENDQYILYGVIDTIVGTTIGVRRPDGTQGMTGTAGTIDQVHGNKALNVVGRLLFKSTEVDDGAANNQLDYANSVILETKTVTNNAEDGMITWCSFLVRDKIGTSEQYGVGYIVANNTSTATKMLQTSYHPNQPEGFTVGVNDLPSNPAGFYVNFFSGGALYSKNEEELLVIRGNGSRPVEDEVWLSTNAVIDTSSRSYPASSDLVSTDIIYAITAPTPPHYTQEYPQQGKYYLIKFDNHVALRVALADFSNMKVWEALGLLAQKADYTMGFAGSTFYFLPNSYLSEKKDIAEITLTDIEDTQDVDIHEIGNFDFNEEDVINLVKVTPSRVVLKEPELTFTYVPRNTDILGNRNKEYEPNVEIVVNQRDNLNKTISLVCVTGGFISQTIASPQVINNLGSKVKFRYRETKASWETSIAPQPDGTGYTIGDIDTNGYIYLSEAVNNIKPGDKLEIHLQFPLFLSTNIATNPESTFIGEYIITQESPYSEALEGKLYVKLIQWNPLLNDYIQIPAGTRIVVYPNNNWSDNNFNLIRNGSFEQWNSMNSSEGLPKYWASAITTYMETEAPHSGDRCVKFRGRSSTGRLEQSLILDTNTSYKFSAWTRGPNQCVAFSGTGLTFTLDNGYRGDNSNRISSLAWTEIRGTLVTTSSGAVDLKLLTFSEEFGYWDDIMLVSGDSINSDYFSPKRHDVFDEIGDTNVYIKFSDENVRNYSNSSNQETLFRPGDRIDINCEGLSLEDWSSGIQVARHETSIKRNGTQEKSVNNKFLSLEEAKNLAFDVVDVYSDSKGMVVVTASMRPGLHLIDKIRSRARNRIDVRSKKYFPTFANYTFRGRLLSISYNRNHVILTLQSIQPN